MNAGGLRNGSQGRKVREEVTTKTMTTTSRQEGNIRGKSSGKTETVKTVTNKVSESGSSQRKVRGGKEEITTTTTTTTTNQSSGNRPRSSQKEQTTAATTKTTTTTTNQRTSSRGPSQEQKAKVVKEVITETSVNRRNSGTQGTKTTTKTVTTAQGQGRSSKSKEASYSSLTTANPTQINTRGNNGRVGAKISQETTVVKSAQKSLINQKSTPALQGLNNDISGSKKESNINISSENNKSKKSKIKKKKIKRKVEVKDLGSIGEDDDEFLYKDKNKGKYRRKETIIEI